MNYRHVYHAGNFADVVKHIVLCLALERLREKDKPFFVLDAHGGTGLYSLQSEQAQKTREFEAGIARVMEQADKAPSELKLYLNAVLEDFAKGKYPGSPLIAARMLRTDDRLIANELHPEDLKTLKQTLGPRDNARVINIDAYEAIRAHIPPEERRGLVLIDPPFEEKNEFDTLCGQISQWKKRWETGTFIIWYPIKAHLAVAKLHDAGRAADFNRTWVCEYLLHARDRPEGLNGAGLLVLNAPYLLPEKIEACAKFLNDAMGGKLETEWLNSA